MLIDATYFLESGLPTSDDIREAEVELAIRTVEQAVVKERLGATLWTAILADPERYSEAVDGSDGVAGLKLAELHLSFAYLLYDRTRLVRYSSVVKIDERSDVPSMRDVLAAARQHWELGELFLDECCKFLEVEPSKEVRTDLIFNELLY